MKSIVEDFDHIALRLNQIEQEKATTRSEDKDKLQESPIVVGEIIWTAGDFDCFG